MNLDVITLSQDIPTRWNSTFYMFEKLLRVKVALCAALPLIDPPPPNLSFAEWAILEDCVKILQPLEIVTKTLSGEFYPTLSSVIPIIQGVKNSINKRTPTTNAGKNLQQILLRNISQRFGYLENDEITAKATILDPRYKKKAFGLESCADKAMALVLNEVKEMTTAEHIEEAENNEPLSVPSNHNIDDEIWENFDMRVVQTIEQTSISLPERLLQEYINLPYLNRKQDPVQFWEERKNIYPALYKMAKKYLCIPATSVPSERLFSKAGMLTNQRRNRLQPNKLNQLLFLNSYYSEKYL
ncbi:zinc finger BED domain-containing protein 1-like [Ctenocephalides felis]|uniref:zinc finger BED domain-containing protein 1-like n=1 Tax=Ctenocephalides felis TaxID=7515 RepID=UPI000E6E4196|nr:zinc finger BED domain-containing protein 1-like [Ctenocephalides felis]